VEARNLALKSCCRCPLEWPTATCIRLWLLSVAIAATDEHLFPVVSTLIRAVCLCTTAFDT